MNKRMHVCGTGTCNTSKHCKRHKYAMYDLHNGGHFCVSCYEIMTQVHSEMPILIISFAKASTNSFQFSYIQNDGLFFLSGTVAVSFMLRYSQSEVLGTSDFGCRVWTYPKCNFRFVIVRCWAVGSGLFHRKTSLTLPLIR